MGRKVLVDAIVIDMVTVIVTTMKGWVYEKDGYELPAAEVRIVGNDGTNRKLSVKGDGSFVLPINPHVLQVGRNG